MTGSLIGGCAAAVFVALVVVYVLWEREAAYAQRWRQWYGLR